MAANRDDNCNRQALAKAAEPETALTRLQKWKLMDKVPKWLLPKLSLVFVTKHPCLDDDDIAFFITDTDEVLVVGNNTDGILDLDPCNKEFLEQLLYNEELSGKGIIDIISTTDPYIYTIVARTIDGKIFTWGQNADGHLGVGLANVTFVCSQVKGVLTEERVVQHCCGSRDVLCLTDSGKLVGWGFGVFPKISGAASAHYSPFAMTWLPPAPIEWIGATAFCFFALTESGDVYSWGKYCHGRTVVSDDDKYTPKKVRLPPGVLVKKVSCGYNYVLLLTTDNQLYSWGRNEFGQIGNGREDGTEVKIPQLIELGGLVSVRDILTVTSERVSFCKTSDGTIYEWGQIAGEKVPVPTATKYKSFDDALIGNDLGMSSKWTKFPAPAEVEMKYNAIIKGSTDKKLVFNVGGKNIKALKFALYRSPVMRRMLETDWKDLVKDREPIELDDIPNRSPFLSLMMFMHTDEVMAADEDLLELVRLANRYEVFALGRQIAKKLEALMTENNALEVYQVARNCGASGLVLAALKKISRQGFFSDDGPKPRKRMKYDQMLIGQLFNDLRDLEFGQE